MYREPDRIANCQLIGPLVSGCAWVDLPVDTTALDWAPLAVGTNAGADESTGSCATGSEGAGREDAPRESEGAALTSAAELVAAGGADDKPARMDEAASSAEEAITDAWLGGTGVPMVVPQAIICIIVIVETWVTVMAGATL